VQVRCAEPHRGERADAIRQVRRAVAMARLEAAQRQGHYAVTGAPVVVNDLTSSITGSVARLLIAALVSWRSRWASSSARRRRLLPLFVAPRRGGLTFGGPRWWGRR